MGWRQFAATAEAAQSVQAAMAELLKAHEYAGETQRSPWDFSLRIRELEALSLTANDFRWLICKQLVEHAREITLPADTGRTFRPESGLTFSRRTCFILSAEGVNYARQALAAATASERSPAPAPAASVEQPRRQWPSQSLTAPRWDPDRRELCLDDQVVKRFRVPCPNQEAVLCAFEEEGWPYHVDDPLPPQPGQNPKRRLSDTIKSLNQQPHQPADPFPRRRLRPRRLLEIAPPRAG